MLFIIFYHSHSLCFSGFLSFTLNAIQASPVVMHAVLAADYPLLINYMQEYARVCKKLENLRI